MTYSKTSDKYHALKLTYLCAVLPLVAGVSIYVAWLITGLYELMVAGMITAGCGLLLNVIGFCLSVVAKRVEGNPNAAPIRRARMILLVNWLAALVIIFVVMNVGRPSTIIIENKTPVKLTGVSYTWGYSGGTIGEISAGSEGTARLWLSPIHSANVVLKYVNQTEEARHKIRMTGGKVGMNPLVVEVRADGSLGLPENAVLYSYEP